MVSANLEALSFPRAVTIFCPNSYEIPVNYAVFVRAMSSSFINGLTDGMDAVTPGLRGVRLGSSGEKEALSLGSLGVNSISLDCLKTYEQTHGGKILVQE